MDYLEKANEAQLKALERRLRTVYRQAYKDVKQTADDYFNDLEARKIVEYEKYKAGEYTPQEFAQWVKTQEARGERYKKMVDDMADRAVSVNQTASDLINGKTPSAYALNANYTAYEIEKGYNSANFELVDESAIKSVLTGDNNVEFRTVNPNPVRDYEWNKTKIENSLLAGILQGQTVSELANSFLTVMKRNENSAYRNARTAMGSACNAGVLDTMKRGQDLGIDVRKQWQSAKDSRVRDSHAFLNGQIRDVNKLFDNGLRYPCDSAGAPAEVYNCRCRIVYILPKYDDDQSNEAYSDDKKPNETYPQWLKRKQEEAKTADDSRIYGKAVETAKRMLKSNEKPSKSTQDIIDIVSRSYNNHIKKNGLTKDINNRLDDIWKYDINLKGLDEKCVNVLKDTLGSLTVKYDSPLNQIRPFTKEELITKKKAVAFIKHDYENDTAVLGLNIDVFKDIDTVREKVIKQMEAGFCVNIGAENAEKYVITHEFAHSLVTTNFDLTQINNYAGADFAKIENARNEIKKAYNKYKEKVTQLQDARFEAEKDLLDNVNAENTLKLLDLKKELSATKLSKYSMKNANEFMAESFVAEQFGVGNEYSKEIMDILTKYFAR